MHIAGLFCSSFQNTASITQASLHNPHPIHFDEFKRTPPPSFGTKASVGQTAAQGGFSHERQTITEYPRDIPPVDFTPIHEFDNPALPVRLEQANMQL
jgi:hypothetical protein